MSGLTDIEKQVANRTSQELPPTINPSEVITIRPLPKLSNGHGHANTVTSSFVNQMDAPTCPNCGSVTVRNGACYKCLNCGESLGCS